MRGVISLALINHIKSYNIITALSKTDYASSNNTPRQIFHMPHQGMAHP